MKVQTFLVLLVFGLSKCPAQQNDSYIPFVEEGKVWSMLYSNPKVSDIYPDYEFQYLIKGDTMISGLNCKKFYVRNGNNNGLTEYKMALCETNKKVLFFPKGSSDSYVLYDFGIPVGSTSYIADPIHPAEGKIKILNNENRQISSDDIDRPCFFINRISDSENGQGHSFPSGWWIEGIGSELGPVNTWSFEAVGNCDYLLKCEINGKTIFTMGNFRSSIITGINRADYESENRNILNSSYSIFGYKIKKNIGKGIYIENGKKKVYNNN